MILIFESFREHIFDDNTRLKWKLKIEENTSSHNLEGCYCQFHVFFRLAYYNQHLQIFCGMCHL